MPKYISFEQKNNFKSGHVTLYDRGGNAHHNKALLIPGFGWVPCSMKLEREFTTVPQELTLIVAEPGDEHIPFTSPVWVTRNNVVTLFKS